jgi:hypothetical protein
MTEINLNKLYKMSKKRNKKKKSFQQMLDYLNDQALMIKQVSREFFKDTDIGTRRHKDKKKYNRKQKHKKRLTDESNT